MNYWSLVKVVNFAKKKISKMVFTKFIICIFLISFSCVNSIQDDHLQVEHENGLLQMRQFPGFVKFPEVPGKNMDFLIKINSFELFRITR